MILFVSELSISGETEFADVHEVAKKGALPQPYASFSVQVSLNQGDHSLKNIEILVGDVPIEVPKDKVYRVKNVDLGSIFIGHEIYRQQDSPHEKLDAQASDYFVVKLASYDGVERNGIWYADYYNIIVDLDTGLVELSKLENVSP